MSNHKVSGKQLGIWMFTGMTAPLAMFASGCDWGYVLISGGICGLASWLVYRRSVNVSYPKALLISQLLWLTAVLGVLIRWVDEGWPMGESYPVVPIALILLAAASASKGAGKAAEVSGILIRITIILYAVVVFVGIGDWHSDYIKPQYENDHRLTLIYLLPALAMYILHQNKWPGKLYPAAIAFAAVICVAVAGGISSQVAMTIGNPFHEWVSGLEIKGITKRMEAVASIGLTLGWFSLLSYLLAVVGNIGERVIKRGEKSAIWLSAATVSLSALFDRWINLETAIIGSVVAWIIAPIIVSEWQKRKMKKTEKSA